MIVSHVLAAAICANADDIVTFNLADFPARTLASHRIEVQHPDVFILGLMELDPATVCTAAKRQRLSFKNPSKSVEQFLALLKRQGLANTVLELLRFGDLL